MGFGGRLSGMFGKYLETAFRMFRIISVATAFAEVCVL